MTTVYETWGFSNYLYAGPDGDAPNRFLAALNHGAVDRGIKPNVPSDALDMSRMIIMSEAGQASGLDWELLPDGTLRLWPIGVTINWDSAKQALENSRG